MCRLPENSVAPAPGDPQTYWEPGRGGGEGGRGGGREGRREGGREEGGRGGGREGRREGGREEGGRGGGREGGITQRTREEEERGGTCQCHPSDSRSIALVCHSLGTVAVCPASRRVAVAALPHYSVHVCVIYTIRLPLNMHMKKI